MIEQFYVRGPNMYYQNRPGINGNEEVLNIPQSSRTQLTCWLHLL